MDSLIGTLLAGRFSIIEQLGEGAMGTVFLAEHVVLGRRYAIKVLKRGLHLMDGMVERFRREARAVSRLDHPNIVGITDFGRTDDERLYLVMEYVPGLSLEDVEIAARPGLLPLPRALELLRQLAGAVGAAHDSGVIHRDLKPENIKLAPGRDGNEQIKILDFGLAKIVGGGDFLPPLTRRGEVFGTPAYMSPEQGLGQGVDTRTDIYAYGVIAYEIFTGVLPFQHTSLARLLIAHQTETPKPICLVRPKEEQPIPDELERLFASCLDKDQDKRPPRISELESAIRDHQRSESSDQTKITVFSNLNVGKRAKQLWENASTLGVPDAGVHELLEAATRPSIYHRDPQDEQREWTWNQICKNAKSLAQLLRNNGIGPVPLSQVLGLIAEIDEQVLVLETEVAIIDSEIEDLDRFTRENESRIRYAIIDLSMERGRVIEHGGPDQPAVWDLDYQIKELEQRLAEVFQQEELRQAEIERSSNRQQLELAELAEKQTENELQLLQLVRGTKPPTGPKKLMQRYERLEQLLLSWE